MTGTEAFLLFMQFVSTVGAVCCYVGGIRLGDKVGYERGYADRDDEILYGEPYGTRKER